MTNDAQSSPSTNRQEATTDQFDKGDRSFFYRGCQGLTRVAGATFWNIKTIDADRVPLHGPALLIANHRSVIDGILLAFRLRRAVQFFAKQTYFDKKVAGWLLRNLSVAPLSAGSAPAAAYRSSLRSLRDGGIVGIFPEGTRNDGDDLLDFQKGFARLAKRSKAAICPAGIVGSDRIWPPGTKRPRFFVQQLFAMANP